MIPSHPATTTELSKLKCKALIAEARYWKHAGNNKQVEAAISIIRSERINQRDFLKGDMPF